MCKKLFDMFDDVFHVFFVCYWYIIAKSFPLHEFLPKDYIFFNNMIFSNNIMEFNVTKHEGGEKIMKLLLNV